MSKSGADIRRHVVVNYQSSSKNVDSSTFSQFRRNDAFGDDNKGGTKRSALVCDSFASKGWCVKGNSCRFLHSKDSYSWEPSTLFQPSFPLTKSLLSRVISIRDSTEQTKPGEVDSVSDACRGSSKCKSFEQSLGGDNNVNDNITNKKNYGDGLVPVETRTPATGRELVDMAGRGAKVEINKNIAKDPRFMREFRTAIKEKVKQVLQPTWHEGKLSKKAHNKIAKKTVDKIMGIIKRFPSTLESADPFSSSLEQNIANLVKYYIDKYGKQ
ncbi:hypothetical protein POM88_034796 [Heracleum sosnowskyi]|uniref:C3H1-type domain-containing protein n=1 Tax=Heracleum sosnowskyi TaxID=360622 RepID=A0AAD8MDI0_9APIA|nr:hypothetical protein POM88_034796 [Heracleum sosnowskyi]